MEPRTHEFAEFRSPVAGPPQRLYGLSHMKWFVSFALVGLAMAGVPGCGQKAAGDKKLVIGVSFETLQTEYWVASFDLMKAELSARGFDIVEAVADGDPNRQLEQVNSFIARKVDGIIVVPHDANSVAPMIRA